MAQTCVLHHHTSYPPPPKKKRVLVDRANYVKGKPLPAGLSAALGHTPEADRMLKQVCHIWLIKANRAELSPEDEIKVSWGGLRRPEHRVLTIALLVKEMPANTNRRTNAVDTLDIVLLAYSQTHPFLRNQGKSGWQITYVLCQ